MITLEVVGLPAPKGSTTRMPNGAYLQGASAGQRVRIAEWDRAVRDAVHRAVTLRRVDGELYHELPLDEPVGMHILFRFPLPKADQYRTRHTTMPDVDKIARLTIDALVPGLLRDDSLVYDLHVQKLYAHSPNLPGATISVWGDGSLEALDRDALKAEVRSTRRAGATS